MRKWLVAEMLLIGLAILSHRCNAVEAKAASLPVPAPVALDGRTSETVSLPKDVQYAFDSLQKAEIFPVSGYIYEDARTPPEIEAFQIVVKSKHADGLFKKLITQKQIVPRLIGLCGVYFTDPKAFLKEGQAMRNGPEMVRVIAGCIVTSVPVQELIGPIEKAGLDDKGRMKPAPKPAPKAGSFVAEMIATGELPLLFKDFRRGAKLATPTMTPANPAE